MWEGESTQNNALLEAQEVRLVVSYELPVFFESITKNYASSDKKALGQKTVHLLHTILTFSDTYFLL